MTDIFPLTSGVPLKFAFATSDEFGFGCSCPAHISKDKRTVLISIDSPAVGMLAMPIIKKRPRGLPEKEAFTIAMEHVEGAIREVFQSFYEPLADFGDQYPPEKIGYYALNEAAMQLVLLSMPDNVIYLTAVDEALAAMKTEAELRKQQKKPRAKKKARRPKPEARQ